MSALWIAHVRVTDPDRYGAYARLATDIIPAHGGVWLVRGGALRDLGRPRPAGAGRRALPVRRGGRGLLPVP
jgi:uncharacterized protein (DUF1330 family)